MIAIISFCSLSVRRVNQFWRWVKLNDNTEHQKYWNWSWKKGFRGLGFKALTVGKSEGIGGIHTPWQVFQGTNCWYKSCCQWIASTSWLTSGGGHRITVHLTTERSKHCDNECNYFERHSHSSPMTDTFDTSFEQFFADRSPIGRLWKQWLLSITTIRGVEASVAVNAIALLSLFWLAFGEIGYK